MKNILIICDIPYWAIDRLTQSIVKYNDRYTIDVVYAHPRDPMPAVRDITNLMREKKYDLVHGMYWRSATQLIDIVPGLKDIPSVVSHHNTSHLTKENWEKYFDMVIAPTKFTYGKLAAQHTNVKIIPYGLEFDDFSYIKNREDNGTTVGSVGRVVDHKNLKLIADTAKELGYRVAASGYVEDVRYWNSIESKDVIDFCGGVGRGEMNTWQDKNALYEKMTVYAMMSSSYETGPLPMLEAMARGIPVIATSQGMVPDILKHEENAIITTPETFAFDLKRLVDDRDLQDKLRQAARRTIQRYTAERMAIEYAKAYRSLLTNEKLVSVIVPTADRVDSIGQVIESVENQSYKNVELIIVDDGKDEIKQFVKDVNANSSIPIQYVRSSGSDSYGLAEARNRGIVEARGELLVFLDDRLSFDPLAVEEFVKETQLGQWNFGSKFTDGKESSKRNFVENFSAIHKADIVRLGMFNERIEWYGGMSEDVRQRCRLNGIVNKHIPSAKANQIRRAEKMKRPEDQWKAKQLLYKLYE